MFAAMVATEGSFGSFQTLWPLYIASLGASPARVGLVIGAVGVIRLLLLLPTGLLADRVAARWIITGGQLAAMLGLLLYALANDWWQLIPAGLLFNGGGAVFPSILAETATISAGSRDRLRAFTLINTVAPSIGFLLAPAAGGLIAARLSLHSVFVFAAVLAAVSAALFATLPSAAPGAERRATVTYGDTLRQPTIRRWLLLEMAGIFCLGVGMVLVPNYLHDVHGLSDGTIGFFGSLSACGSMALGLLVHRLAFFRRSFRAVGLALGSVALALILALLGGGVVVFGASYVLLGGFLATWTLFEGSLAVVTPPAYRARTYALAELLSGGGMALAPFVAGVLYERAPRAPMLLSVLLVAVLLLVMTAMSRRGAFQGTERVEAVD